MKNFRSSNLEYFALTNLLVLTETDNKAIAFRFDDWLIEPHLNQIRRGDESKG